MLNGGNPTLIWGFLVAWIGNLAVAASLAELASIAPTAGGQYHWTAMLAPERHKAFLSWITGNSSSLIFTLQDPDVNQAGSQQ